MKLSSWINIQDFTIKDQMRKSLIKFFLYFRYEIDSAGEDLALLSLNFKPSFAYIFLPGVTACILLQLNTNLLTRLITTHSQDQLNKAQNNRVAILYDTRLPCSTEVETIILKMHRDLKPRSETFSRVVIRN